MKTENIFDLLPYDPEELDERTVIRAADADSEHIRKAVLERIGKERQKPAVRGKKSRRFISLAAAVLVSAVLCMAVGARDMFSKVFDGDILMKGQRFSVGDTPYEGQSEAVNIRLEGVTGDDNTVCAVYTLTKKDGSDFLSSIVNRSVLFFEDDDTDRRISVQSATDGKTGISDNCYIRYSILDSKTLKAFLYVKENKCGQKSRISVTEKSVYAYRPVRVLYRFEDSTNPLLSQRDQAKKNGEKYRRIVQEYEAQQKEHEVIRLYDGKVILFEREEIQLNYSLSLQPEFTEESRELVTTPVSVALENNLWTVERLTVNRFGMTLDMHTDKQTNSVQLFTEKIYFVLSDGMMIKAEVSEGGTYHTEDENGKQKYGFKGYYVFSERTNGYVLTPINPQDVVAVIIGDVRLEAGDLMAASADS